MNIDLLLRVFKYKFLKNIIFDKVKEINRIIVKNKSLRVFKWNELLSRVDQLAGYNYIEQFKYFLNCNPIYIDEIKNDTDDKTRKSIGHQIQTIANIISFGNIDCVKIIFDQFRVFSNEMVQSLNHLECDIVGLASKFGRLDVIRFLETLECSKYYNWDYRCAAMSGDLEIFKYVMSKHQNNFKLKVNIEDNAFCKSMITFRTNVELFKYVMENYNIDPLRFQNLFLLRQLVFSSNLSILNYLKETYDIFNSTTSRKTYLHKHDLVDIAIKTNNLEIVKWILANTSESVSTYSMDVAAEVDSMEIVLWLHQNFTNCISKESMHHAALNNNMEMLVWLHQNRTEGCTTLAMDNAVRSGDLEMIKWLHANRTEGCTIQAFLDCKSLEVLKWLSLNQSKIYDIKQIDHFNTFIQSDNVEILDWLLHDVMDGNIDRFRLKDIKLSFNSIEVFKWFHQNCKKLCLEYRNILVDCIRSRSNDHSVAKWIVEHIPDTLKLVSTKEIDILIYDNQFELVKLICTQHSRLSNLITIETLYTALKRNNLEIIQWILNSHCIPLLQIIQKHSQWEKDYRIFKKPFEILTNFINSKK